MIERGTFNDIIVQFFLNTSRSFVKHGVSRGHIIINTIYIRKCCQVTVKRLNEQTVYQKVNIRREGRNRLILNMLFVVFFYISIILCCYLSFLVCFNTFQHYFVHNLFLLLLVQFLVLRYVFHCISRKYLPSVLFSALV